MSLPKSWIDELFTRLHLRYGATFMRQYDGLDTDAVKADWANTLDGFVGADIRYALDYLPDRFPPNAQEFRNLCRRSPPEVAQVLPAPEADPKVVRMVMEAIRSAPEAPKRSLAAQCIDNIIRRHGEAPKSVAARDMLAACKRHLAGSGDYVINGGGRMIQNDELPPGMRSA
jgi:hypothetical protein